MPITPSSVSPAIPIQWWIGCRTPMTPHLRPKSQSLPLSAKPFGFFSPCFKLSSSPTALSHLALSRFACSISSADGLKTLAAPPRPTCWLEVDSRLGGLSSLLAWFRLRREVHLNEDLAVDIPNHILRTSCSNRIIVARHVSTSSSACSIDFAFEGWGFEGYGVEVGRGVADVAWQIHISFALKYEVVGGKV